jgi:probable FeS assembly SUF system protein SufT
MSNERVATRDIPATIVPYGDQVTIPEGTVVTITHRLGGNFTVTWEGGMAQINGVHGDAIGEEKVEIAAADTDHEGPPSDEAIWDAMRKVFDPEIPVNVVDLGLIYSMVVSSPEDDDSVYDVHIDMTLTAPGCGMGPVIAQDVKMKVETVPGVNEANVEIVWDPPWHQDMISEEGKMELGLL